MAHRPSLSSYHCPDMTDTLLIRKQNHKLSISLWQNNLLKVMFPGENLSFISKVHYETRLSSEHMLTNTPGHSHQ